MRFCIGEEGLEIKGSYGKVKQWWMGMREESTERPRERDIEREREDWRQKKEKEVGNSDDKEGQTREDEQ